MCLYNVEHNFQESRKGASNAELITLIESNNIKRTISVERGAKNDIHKKIHCNFASFVLAFTALSSTAFASNGIASKGKRIPYSELPEGYKSVISSDAIIYQQTDGSYDIYQSSPVLKQTGAKASQRYAPKGGSYSDLKNGWITSLTCVVYQTYLPRNNVNIWISEQVPDIRSYIIDKISSMGTGAIVKYISEKWGYAFLASAVVEIANGAKFVLSWLNFNQVDTASNHGQNGILIEYLTNIGSGNARVYSAWTSSYVPMEPYGGSATWHAEDYYVMP